MGEILKGATLIELTPPRLEQADLRIEGNKIEARGPQLAPKPGDRVTDLRGRLVMPGLVMAHTHLYSTLARGMPAPEQPLKTFRDPLEQVWWRLDRALDERLITLSAQVGAAEALLNGVTTVFDHHASPSFVEGSLAAVRRGVASVGARSVLCYEISDRNGKGCRDAALREADAFLKGGRSPRCAAMVGGDSSFTLDDDSLDAMVALATRHDVGLHLHVAESPDDERDARKRFDKGVMERLDEHGVLTPRTLLVHCTHLSWEELSLAQQRGCWMIHNPRSNMHNSVGYAPAGKFGARKALGTDGIGSDLIGEAQFAFFKAREAGFKIDPLHWLAGGQHLSAEIFGQPLGQLEPGAIADLVLLDYPSPTPLVAQNLTSHVALGLSASHVDAVMVDGAWRVWARQLLSLDYEELRAKAAEGARQLWSRMSAG
ncbi:MAG TPA: ssnA protein [Myxococcales bacterium]|nr:ssnA protein [Myxococcales bacterium]